MGKWSRAAARARATSGQGRREQAEPCPRELQAHITSHPLLLAQAGATLLALPPCQLVSPHACPSCSSPIPAQRMPKQTGMGLQPHAGFNFIHPPSTQQPGHHICSLTINLSIIACPRPNQPQGMRDLQKRAPYTDGAGVFFKGIVYHTGKMIRYFQNCFVRPSFLASMSCGEKAKGSL